MSANDVSKCLHPLNKLTVSLFMGFYRVLEGHVDCPQQFWCPGNSCFYCSVITPTVNNFEEQAWTTDCRDYERHHASGVDCSRVRVLYDPCFHHTSSSSSQDSRTCNLISRQQCFRSVSAESAARTCVRRGASCMYPTDRAHTGHRVQTQPP